MASILVSGDTSGAITISAPAISGTNTLTLPAVTDTLVGKATTDTLTNKSIVASQLTGTVAVANGGTGVAASKQLIQNLNTTTGAMATGTTTIPQDDTIPQITEGTQFMTLAITPTSATSVLQIDVIAIISLDNANYGVFMPLFRDAVANALAVSYFQTNAANAPQTIPLKYIMVAGTTSAITFRVRIGGQLASTVTFNGRAGGALMGGTLASSITIKEYTA